jgi:hypothetical protein
MTARNGLATTALLAALLLSQALHAQSQALANSFVPEVVFAGHSQGTGELRLLLGRERPFTVDSVGTTQAGGRFRLEQDVRSEGQPPHSRTFVMWQTSPGHYAATLTDAVGPVLGDTDGNRLTLRYRLNRWGLVMHQTLELARDERTVLNYGRIRFLGIPIGTLRETIVLKH